MIKSKYREFICVKIIDDSKEKSLLPEDLVMEAFVRLCEKEDAPIKEQFIISNGPELFFGTEKIVSFYIEPDWAVRERDNEDKKSS